MLKSKQNFRPPHIQRRCLVFRVHILYMIHLSSMPPIGIKLVWTYRLSTKVSHLQPWGLYFGKPYLPNLLQEHISRNAITTKRIYPPTSVTSLSNNGGSKTMRINGNRCTRHCFQEKQSLIHVSSSKCCRLYIFS
jgi:hypothetical protein